MEYVQAEFDHFSKFLAGQEEDERLESYVERLRQLGEWGGEVELAAMSELYGRTIEVYRYDTQPSRTYRQQSAGPPLRVSYHFNSHYNSVVAVDGCLGSGGEDGPGRHGSGDGRAR